MCSLRRVGRPSGDQDEVWRLDAAQSARGRGARSLLHAELARVAGRSHRPGCGGEAESVTLLSLQRFPLQEALVLQADFVCVCV